MTDVDQDAIDFDAAHARFVELQAHPTVQDLAKQLMTGSLTPLQFMERLAEVPEVAAALKMLGGGAETVVAGEVTGLAAPLGLFAPLAGAAAAGLFHLASGALAHYVSSQNTTPPSSSS